MLLALNGNLLEALEKTDRDNEIREAIGQAEGGEWSKAMRNFVRIARLSRSRRESAKWLFCAVVAPFAPRENFQAVITDPASKSILKILRYHLGGSSDSLR